MPGAYAHLTLANCLRETQRLESTPGFPVIAIRAVLEHFEYVELGAVSPDYPYLAIRDSKAARWADAMHYTNTGGMIRAGVELLRGLDVDKHLKELAWLLGYTSHVVADMTIHPVVELKVGTYDDNKGEHRVCEMNQDAYVFQRLNIGPLGLSNHLCNGIARCGTLNGLDDGIVSLWNAMMQRVHPEEYAANPPDIHKWHRGFVKVLSTISHGQQLMPLSRHVAAGIGLTYPAPDDVAPEFIDELHVPGGFLGYDLLFDRAVDNAFAEWGRVAASLFGVGDHSIAHLGEWNLDTGRNAFGHLVYWG